MDLNIAGRKALITGAASGIGWTTARTLLTEGAIVVMTDLDPDKLRDAADEFEVDPQSLFAFAADVKSIDSVNELERKVREAVGDIDILVQAAGIHGAGGSFETIDDADWHETIEVDLLGPIRVARTFLPALRRGGWGRMVFIASEDAVQPYSEELPYCVAKAGIVNLAKGLSRDYAQEGLLVNTVSPAFIATAMTDKMMTQRADDRGTSFDEAIKSFLDEERPSMAIKRRGKPQEVADVIAFLCSDRASFVNGSNYRVDAGSVWTT